MPLYVGLSERRDEEIVTSGINQSYKINGHWMSVT